MTETLDDATTTKRPEPTAEQAAAAEPDEELTEHLGHERHGQAGSATGGGRSTG
jgi:hypothetical protein